MSDIKNSIRSRLCQDILIISQKDDEAIASINEHN